MASIVIYSERIILWGTFQACWGVKADQVTLISFCRFCGLRSGSDLVDA